jgi:hypothetical protein
MAPAGNPGVGMEISRDQQVQGEEVPVMFVGHTTLAHTQNL